MSYPQVSIDTAAQELNRLHQGIEANLQQTVQDAIRAGEILSHVKAQKSHGEFLPWLKANCSFSPDTAERYRKLHAHHNKIRSVRNLQEAYKQVETIEKQEKQSEYKRAMSRVKEYRRTGVKPDGWRRGTDDKLVEEEEERDRRINDARLRAQRAEEQRQEQQENRRENTERMRVESEWFGSVVDEINSKQDKRATFKERIRISDTGRDDAFIDALMDYLEELDDDNRRIEACYNIIKVAKGIAVELQSKDGGK